MQAPARVLVIADDATGAGASAALLACRGLVARAVFRPPRAWPPGVDALAVSIQSRRAPAADARARAFEAAAWGVGQGVGCIGKRIDSTLRGHVGAEIEGVLAALPQAAALVVPAFPRSHRVALGGRVFWDGRPLERSMEREGADDLATSHVPTAVRRETPLPIAEVPLRAVGAALTDLARSLGAARAAGARIVVADAATDVDLARLAAAAHASGQVWVPVDPGPFVAAYARPQPSRGPRACVLGVVGSRTPLTYRQLDVLRACGAAIVTVPPADDAASCAAAAAAAHEAVVLACAPAPAEAGRLARAARRVLEGTGSRIAGLYVSGGDTLEAVCESLGAWGVDLTGEVEPLVAAGRLVGGAWAGLPLVAKGGLVGDAGAALRCVRYLLR